MPPIRDLYRKCSNGLYFFDWPLGGGALLEGGLNRAFTVVEYLRFMILTNFVKIQIFRGWQFSHYFAGPAGDAGMQQRRQQQTGGGGDSGMDFFQDLQVL